MFEVRRSVVPLSNQVTPVPVYVLPVLLCRVAVPPIISVPPEATSMAPELMKVPVPPSPPVVLPSPAFTVPCKPKIPAVLRNPLLRRIRVVPDAAEPPTVTLSVVAGLRSRTVSEAEPLSSNW